jgi:hypothetical protein
MDRTELPPVLDVKHLQQILGIGRVQAYDLANSGQFHVVRIGKRIKISREVFINWLEGSSVNLPRESEISEEF